jgi:hypothetical protein
MKSGSRDVECRVRLVTFTRYWLPTKNLIRKL